ncbi:MAG: hypothetical protein ABIP65_03955 [Vicinamibacterales bacterium]
MFACIRRPRRALAALCVVAFAAPCYAQSTAPVPTPQATAPEAALPAAQVILDRHVEATGGRKALAARTSVRTVGSVSIPANGMTGTIEVFAARPNRMLVKTTIAGIGEISEGFDGTHSWSMSPMTGPMLATGEELVQKSFDADFDGALNVTSRYQSIKTLEKTTFDGRPCYKLSLIRKDGGEDIEFYDVATGLKAGSIVSRKSPMGTVTATSTLTDYKKFGEILQPTVLKQSMTGVEIVTTFSAIEYDKVDPATFDLPAPIKALVK